MPNLGQYSPTVLIAADYLSRLVAQFGGIPVFPVAIPVAIAGVATADFDVVCSEKFEVIDVLVQKRNGAGAANTIQVKNGATAISDAIATAVDNALTRAASIDDAASTIAAAGTLRITGTRAAGTLDALVTVWGFIRP